MENFRLKFHLLCDLRFCLSGVTSNDTLGCIKVLRSNISPSSPLLIHTDYSQGAEILFICPSFVQPPEEGGDEKWEAL